MKKPLISLLILFIVLCAIFIGTMLNYKNSEKQILSFNKEYEQYMDKIVLGSEIATLINKATNNNEKNKIEKTNDGKYINNGINSIQIFIKLTQKKDYFPMETISEHKISEFVRNFNLQDFKCTKITYHDKTKQVAQLYFDIIE